MKKTHASLALVLDRSGSMAPCLEAAISATNEFLRDQGETDGSADLTITLFDDRIEHPFVATDIQDVPKFDTTSFVPCGSTALLDAIGHTVDQLGERLASAATSRKARAFRASAHRSLDAGEALAMEADLDQMVAEEDRKRREE